jgi:S1-C subfamily serine protease
LVRARKNKGKAFRGIGVGPVGLICRTVFLALSVGFLIVGSAMPQARRASKTKKPPSPLTAREIAKRALPSVVLLVTEDANGKAVALGTGFQVKPDVIATNYHVIKDASRAYATFQGGSPKYEILGTIAVDKENDLVLLRLGRVIVQQSPYDSIVAMAASLLPLATARVEIGDTVYVVGNPEGLEGTFSQGIVSAVRGSDYIQITAPISHGSSGGPVLNGYGEVIGVAAGAIEEGQNLNFAIPVSKLAALIRAKNERQRRVAPTPPVTGLVPSSPNEPVAQWQFVGSSVSEQFFISRADIRLTPEHTLLAWIKNVPTDSPEGRASRKGDIDFLNKQNVNRSYAFSYAMDQWEFDCAHQKARYLQSAYYDLEGKLLFDGNLSRVPEETRNRLTRWEPVLPNSVEESRLNFACKGRH